jgi:hypothetical protein
MMSKRRKAKVKRTRTKRERPLAPGRAGWSIEEYFPGQVGFGGRTTFHALTPELKPRHIQIGRRNVITEPASEYLKRLEQVGQPIRLVRAA